MEKHSVSRLSYLFAHLHLLSSYSFSSTLLSSNLSLLYASSLLCFSSLHIVGSLTSKLPSTTVCYKACTNTFQYYRILQSLQKHVPVLPYTTTIAQTYIYIYIQIDMYTYKHTNTHTHTHIHTYTYTYTCTCTCTYTNTCTYTYTYTYTYIYIDILIHLHLHIQIQIQIHIHIQIHIDIHIHAYTYTYIYIHIHIHTHTYTYMGSKTFAARLLKLQRQRSAWQPRRKTSCWKSTLPPCKRTAWLRRRRRNRMATRRRGSSVLSQGELKNHADFTGLKGSPL